jgi:hypothetical protein
MSPGRFEQLLSISQRSVRPGFRECIWFDVPRAGTFTRANQEKSMRKLIVAAFISLDGVIQAPGGPDEDTSGEARTGSFEEVERQ